MILKVPMMAGQSPSVLQKEIQDEVHLIAKSDL
jgi:hypothetical protein